MRGRTGPLKRRSGLIRAFRLGSATSKSASEGALPMLRLFVGLPLSQDAVDAVEALMGGLPGARWQATENLHVTLSFLGDVAEPDAEDLIDALGDAADGPVQLKGTRIQGFGRVDQPRSLVVALDQDPGLMALQKRVDRIARDVGLEPDRRKFLPHVTVGRLGRGVDPVGVERWMTAHIGAALPEWTATEMMLWSSITRPEGSLYRVEAGYRLNMADTDEG
jgi:2'-5' RNA ligase